MSESRPTLPEYVTRNRRYWDVLAREYEEPGRCAWQSAEPCWGIWSIPESELCVLPDVAGKDVIELGCGTAYAILMLCVSDEEDQPAGGRLLRPYFGMHRFDWPDGTSVEFHLGHGDWLRLLRRYGFEVEDLIEIQAPDGARNPSSVCNWSLGAKVACRGDLEGAETPVDSACRTRQVSPHVHGKTIRRPWFREAADLSELAARFRRRLG